MPKVRSQTQGDLECGVKTATDLLKEARMVIHDTLCFQDLDGIWHDPTCQEITEYLNNREFTEKEQGGSNAEVREGKVGKPARKAETTG